MLLSTLTVLVYDLKITDSGTTVMIISMFVIPLPTYLVDFPDRTRISYRRYWCLWGRSTDSNSVFNVAVLLITTPFVWHYRSVPAVLS